MNNRKRNFSYITTLAGICGTLISGTVLAQDFSTPGASCTPALVSPTEVAQVNRSAAGITWENTAKSMDFHCGGGTAYFNQTVSANFYVHTPSPTAQPVTCHITQLYGSNSPFGYRFYIGRITSKTTSAATQLSGAGVNHRLDVTDTGYNQGISFNYYCTLPKKISESTRLLAVNSSHP